MTDLSSQDAVQRDAKEVGAAIAQIIADFASRHHVRVTGVEVRRLVINGDSPSISYAAWPIVEIVAGVMTREG